MPFTAASPQDDTLRVVAGFLFAGAAVAVLPHSGMAAGSLASTSIGLLAKPNEAFADFIDNITGDSPAKRFGAQLGLITLGGLAVRLSHGHIASVASDGVLLVVANHLTPLKQLIPQAKAFAGAVSEHATELAGSFRNALKPSKPLISPKPSAPAQP